MFFFVLIICLLVSYLLGSVPWGYLLAGWLKKIDIRDYGSGNIGFTNVLRTSGFPTAAAVLLLDGGKGAISVGLVAPGCLYLFGGGDLLFGQMAAFGGVVLGHIFPVFLRFRGGKGVATAGGALLIFSPPAFIICSGIWLILVGLSRRVSPASLGAAAAMVPVLGVVRDSPAVTVFSALIAGLIIFRHRGNIRRLRAGEEVRIWKKK